MLHNKDLVKAFLDNNLFVYKSFKAIPLKLLYLNFNGRNPGALGKKQFGKIVLELKPNVKKRRMNINNETHWVYEGLL